MTSPQAQNLLTIDLDVVRSAAPREMANQIFKSRVERLAEMIEEFRDLAESREGRPAGLAFEALPRRAHLHEAILLAGARGSGKSTILLSLSEILATRDANRTPGPGHRSVRIIVLENLDPTLIEGGEVFLAAILASILRFVEPHWNRFDLGRIDAVNRTLEELADGLLVAHNDGWRRALAEDSSGARFADRLVGYARAGIDLAQAFANFVSAVSDLYGGAVFVLPIDDVDIAGKSAWPALEAVRKFLTGPRLLPIIAGDFEQFQMIVLQAKLEELSGLIALAKTGLGADVPARALADAGRLTEQYFLKLARPERRIVLGSAEAELRTQSVQVAWYDRERQTRRTVSLDDLVKPLCEWTGAPRAALLPANARSLGATLRWAASQYRDDSQWERRADYLGLLSVETSAATADGISRDAVEPAAHDARYGSLLAWFLSRSDPGDRLQMAGPDSALWPSRLVNAAVVGQLRTRFAPRPAEPFRFLVQCALPVALAAAWRLGPQGEGAEARAQLVRAGSTPSCLRTLLRLAAQRWDRAGTTGRVGACLAVLPEGDPSLASLKSMLTAKGDDDRFNCLAPWFAYRGSKSPPPPLLLGLSTHGTLIGLTPTPKALASMSLVVGLTTGRVASSDVDARLVDPLRILGVVAELLDCEPKDFQPTLARMLADSDNWVEAVAQGEPNANRQHSTPAAAISTGDEVDKALLKELEGWWNYSRAILTRHPPSPQVIATISEGLARYLQHKSISGPAMGSTIGSLLADAYLALVNVALVAEVADQKVLPRPDFGASHLRIGPLKDGAWPTPEPAGPLLSNLRVIADSSALPADRAPMAWALAMCPITLAALPETWRLALCRYLNPRGGVPPAFRPNSFSPGHSNEPDLAEALHGILVHNPTAPDTSSHTSGERARWIDDALGRGGATNGDANS